MKKIVYYFAVILLAVATRASAQYNPYQLSVAAEASVQEQPPRITLSWLQDDSAKSYEVYRYDTNQGYWNLMSSVGKKLTWTDTNVAIGVPYEYEIVRSEER